MSSVMRALILLMQAYVCLHLDQGVKKKEWFIWLQWMEQADSQEQ